MGFYYVAPLLGASLSPIIGGGLTSAFTWRGAFWFCTIDGGAVFLSFLLLFKDTYRCERSLTYQNVVKAKLREVAQKKSVEAAKAEFGSDDTGFGSSQNASKDLEKQDITAIEASKIVPEVRLGLRDINPFTPMLLTIRRTYNIFMLLASGT